MNVLILAEQKLLPLRRVRFYQGVQARFLEINQRGLVTFAFLAISALGVLLYLSAFYFSFHYGFLAQNFSKQILSAEQTVVQKELALRGKENMFSQGSSPLLEGMEKISAIKYLSPETVAESKQGLIQ